MLREALVIIGFEKWVLSPPLTVPVCRCVKQPCVQAISIGNYMLLSVIWV